MPRSSSDKIVCCGGMPTTLLCGCLVVMEFENGEITRYREDTCKFSDDICKHFPRSGNGNPGNKSRLA